MSESIEQLPLQDALPDFQPACEGFEGPFEQFPDDPACQNPAVWILTHSCCGGTVLSCDLHLQQRAPRQNRLGGLIRWKIKCTKCGDVKPGDLPLSARFIRIERI